jgi:hypothetical protein
MGRFPLAVVWTKAQRVYVTGDVDDVKWQIDAQQLISGCS